MSNEEEQAKPDAPAAEKDEAEEEMPPHVIEGARSSRSKCKTCRKKIEKGNLRLGIFVDGAFGAGYMWHHVTCAPKRRWDDVEAAYQEEAWKFAKDPVNTDDLPKLEDLKKTADAADKTRAERKTIPYIEVAPSARSKCAGCQKGIEKDAYRIILGRDVEFGNQYRTTPTKFHPGCAKTAIDEEPDIAEVTDLERELRANSGHLTAEQIDAAIGQL